MQDSVRVPLLKEDVDDGNHTLEESIKVWDCVVAEAVTEGTHNHVVAETLRE